MFIKFFNFFFIFSEEDWQNDKGRNQQNEQGNIYFNLYR